MADRTPRELAGDAARTVVLGGLGAVDLAAPGIGTALTTIVGEVWIPSAQRRTIETLAEIDADLEAFMVQTNVAVDELRELSSDPVREELALRAAREAIATADDDHRRRCRAALLNGLAGDEDATLALRFTQLLGELTPAHFDFLSQLKTTTETGLPADYLLNHEQWSETLLRLILDDLDSRGLIARERTIDANRSLDDGPEPLDDAVGDARVTELGERLVAHVTMPVEGR